jgi:hypothetical protein
MSLAAFFTQPFRPLPEPPMNDMNHRQSNHVRSLCVCLAALTPLAVLLPSGCSTPFASCEATASCTPDQEAGAGGEGVTGGADSGGTDGASGGTGGVSGGTKNESGSGGAPTAGSAGMGGDPQNENGGAGAFSGGAGESGAPSLTGGAAGQATGGDGAGGTDDGPSVCVFGNSVFGDGCVFGP